MSDRPVATAANFRSCVVRPLVNHALRAAWRGDACLSREHNDMIVVVLRPSVDRIPADAPIGASAAVGDV
jgi:hypothetical protein